MNILYLHQYFTTRSGAGGTRSYEMARRLVEAGHRVTVVCASAARSNTGLDGPFIDGMRRGTVDGITVVEYQSSYSNAQGFAARIAAFLRYSVRSSAFVLREPADLIFATSTPLTVAVPALVASIVRRRPYVFEVRDLWPELPQAMGIIRNPLLLTGLRWLERLTYRRARRLVALSPGIEAGIRSAAGPDTPVCVVPNGCDLDLFGTAPTPWRPDDVPAGDLLAIFTGAHGRANGLDAVIGAAQVLKQRNARGITLLLVGEGSEKPRLMAQVQAEGLQRWVRFHPAMPKQQVANLMAGADVGLQLLANIPAFYYGTSPNKFFDYLAAGLPVLTNYPGWVADLVTTHAAGFAVPPDSAEAFADALMAAAADRAQLKTAGANARALAADAFDRDVLGARFVDWVTGSEPPEDECAAARTTGDV